MSVHPRVPAWLCSSLWLVCSCAGQRAHAPVATQGAVASKHVQSNVLRADYAGSRECGLCHSQIYEAWKDSPMHRMTRDARRVETRAPFDGATFHLHDDVIEMSRQGGARFMRLRPVQGHEQLYRITKVIGGRYREDYAGIDVTTAADPATDRGRGAEQIMPVSYVFSTQSWRYKGYSVMLPERPGLRAGPVWGETCIVCHNTLPYLTMLYDDLYGPEAPSYQGRISDHLLPPARAWTSVPDDEPALKAAIAEEVAFIGRPGLPAWLPLRDVLTQAMRGTHARLSGEHLIELGVGCEACHGGARTHANDPRVLPSFAAESPLMHIVQGSGRAATRAERINQTCAHCHTVLFSGYPWTWEGGRRNDAVPGGSSTNSGEARDLLLSRCSTQLSCVQCHDPHTEDPRERLRALEGPAGAALCTSCHRQFSSAPAVAAHTHHRPEGAGSACINCHMPRKNMGLSYALTRYHRIGSPTDSARVLADRPLECALCHSNKSVQSLVRNMEQWWHKRYDRQQLQALYGPDLEVNVMASTLARGKPHEQAVAMAVLGDAHDRGAVPQIATQLAHPYPLVRYFASHALASILGAPIPVDVNASAADVTERVRQWLALAER